MGAENYIRAITAQMTEPDTDVLLYEVPQGNTFIAFMKAVNATTITGIRVRGNHTQEIHVPTVDVTFVQGSAGDGLGGTYNLIDGSANDTTGVYSYEDNGDTWFLWAGDPGAATSEWYVHTGPYIGAISISHAVDTGISGAKPNGSSDICTLRQTIYGTVSWFDDLVIDTGDGSATVTFKESTDGGTSKETCAIVTDAQAERIKERYEGGTSIYINAAYRDASSSGSGTFAWGDVSSFTVTGFGSDTTDGTYTYSDNADGNGNSGYYKVQGQTYFYVNGMNQTVLKLLGADFVYYQGIADIGGTSTWYPINGGSSYELTLTAGSGSSSSNPSFVTCTASIIGILFDANMVPIEYVAPQSN